MALADAPASHEIAWHWLRQGWKFRGCQRWPTERQARYRARVKREMSVIESKDFTDYFLIVSDLVRYAKGKGYAVGPARGSAAASLVCWLLRITEVDPLLYPNLVFERFIDESRADLPDIDLDFESECRLDLYHYWAEKYGAECVANIGTFTYYRAKNSLDDVARGHRVPAWEVAALKDRIITRSPGDLRASDTIEDTLEMFPDARAILDRHPELAQSQELEGNVKGQSVHAAGLVVSSGPLRKVAPVYGRKVAGAMREVLVFDKYDAERQGLLKVDILGLSTMSMIAECLRWIGMPLEELYRLPLDDEKVYDAFRANDVAGVFQFDGVMQSTVSGRLKPDHFGELCDVNALARPGPLHNGAVEQYIRVKQKAADPDRLHPLFDAICSATHGQAVYQEQILRAVTEIGGFDWTAAAYIRKIMSRKLGEQEFARQGARFAKGALERGVSASEAAAIWRKCVTAGSYAFNAAHCVSYAMIGYWCMWLKVYHPAAFYAASLKHSATAVDRKRGIDKPVGMIRDALRHGLEVLPPSLQRSGVSWQPIDGALQMGFVQIPGIGDKMAENIVSWREQWGLDGPAGDDWDSLLAIRGIGATTVTRIRDWCSKPDPFGALRLGQNIAAVTKMIREDPSMRHLPVPTHTAAELSGDHVPGTVVWVGVVHHRNLRDIFDYHLSRTGEHLDPSTVKSPELNESAMMHARDTTEAFRLVASRWRYPKLKERIWDLELSVDVVLVRGRMVFHSLDIHDLWVFSP